jgi:hypothetical protein
MRTRAAVASLILTPLSITVLVASCNPGTPSGGDAGDANADGPFSCNPPPDYANCASCVETNCGGPLQSICAGFENAYCGCIDHPVDAGTDAGKPTSPTGLQCINIAANTSCQGATVNCISHGPCVCPCAGGCDGGIDSGPDAPTDVGSDAMSCVNQFFIVLEGEGTACAACLESKCSAEVSAFATDCSAALSCACPGGVLSVDAGNSATCTALLDAAGCLASFHAIQTCATAAPCIPPCK